MRFGTVDKGGRNSADLSQLVPKFTRLKKVLFICNEVIFPWNVLFVNRNRDLPPEDVSIFDPLFGDV